MSSKNETSITEKGKLGRVVALAVLGYAFILMLLVVQIFLVAWSGQYAISDIGSLYFQVLAGFLAVTLFIGVYHLFRAIFARSWSMDGYELPADTPLHKAMQEIAEKIGSPAPSKIFIDDEFLDGASLAKRFREVDAAATHEDDTHPSLVDAVTALGLGLEAPSPLSESGLELLRSPGGPETHRQRRVVAISRVVTSSKQELTAATAELGRWSRR